DRADPVTYSGAPYHFEKSPWQINRPPPQLGEHNKEIFKEIGLSLQDIDALQRDSII
ncbi:MAG TPA: CoA transferase, partial [Gammaproteobacteria bacterium]|nr:CoA transferase [Gammaproteobacteria bacterium]